MRAYGIENYKGVFGTRKGRGKGFRHRFCSCCQGRVPIWKRKREFKKKARAINKKSIIANILES